MAHRGGADDEGDRIEKLEDRVRDIERFQSWLTGIGVGAGAIMGLVIEAIRKKVGL